MLAEANILTLNSRALPHQPTERVNLPLPQLLRQIWRPYLQLVGLLHLKDRIYLAFRGLPFPLRQSPWPHIWPAIRGVILRRLITSFSSIAQATVEVRGGYRRFLQTIIKRVDSESRSMSNENAPFEIHQLQNALLDCGPQERDDESSGSGDQLPRKR